LIAVSPLAAAAATVSNQGGVVVIDGAPTPAPVHRRLRPAQVRPSPTPALGSARGAALARYAMAFVGTPYVWGGSTPSGFDCSGFAQYVYAAAGIGIPRTADLQFAVGRPVAEPAPGDLLFFQTYDYGASHVAIYLGAGWFVQAIAPDVHLSNFDSPYFRSRYLGARRLLPA
jgi:cell wall-associated NlpC family hydrolase